MHITVSVTGLTESEIKTLKNKIQEAANTIYTDASLVGRIGHKVDVFEFDINTKNQALAEAIADHYIKDYV